MYSFRNHLALAIRAALVVTMVCTTLARADDAAQIRLGTRASEVMVTKLVVSDLHRSLDFYTQVIGLKEFTLPGIARPAIDDPKAGGSLYLNFSGSPSDPFLALVKRADVVPTAESVKVAMVCFKVPSTREVVKRAREAQVSVVLEPREFMGVVVAIIRDPDGYEIELNEAETMTTPAALKH